MYGVTGESGGLEVLGRGIGWHSKETMDELCDENMRKYIPNFISLCPIVGKLIF